MGKPGRFLRCRLSKPVVYTCTYTSALPGLRSHCAVALHVTRSGVLHPAGRDIVRGRHDVAANWVVDVVFEG